MTVKYNCILSNQNQTTLKTIKKIASFLYAFSICLSSALAKTNFNENKAILVNDKSLRATKIKARSLENYGGPGGVCFRISSKGVVTHTYVRTLCVSA